MNFHGKILGYTLGADGLWRKPLTFEGGSEIVVRDKRGNLVRVERNQVASGSSATVHHITLTPHRAE